MNALNLLVHAASALCAVTPGQEPRYNLSGLTELDAKASMYAANEFPMVHQTRLDKLKIDTVVQNTGYLDTTSGNELFYWFFASKSDPSKDPLVIWLNGGPGCSSMEAVLFENGPVMMANNVMNPNKHSWNSKANVLYIDNPAGVGYSIAEDPRYDTPSAAEDFRQAILNFFEKYPYLLRNDLHISGESYAGRYIPVFADAINADGNSTKRVKSVLIGNGLVNPVAEYTSYAPMLCGEGGRPSKLTSGHCDTLKSATPRCVKQIQGCMENNHLNCMLARPFCAEIESAFMHYNPYDIRDPACQPSKTQLCYAELDNVQDFYNLPETKQALGIKDVNSEFQICNNKMNGRFNANEDPYQPTFQNITNLLEGNTSVLVYNGDADIILNWLGGLQWTRELEWSGKEGFVNASTSLQKFVSNNKPVGEFANYKNFTFMRVYNAGHMVPHDQPENALAMLNTWLQQGPSFGVH